jgi:tight adherence protein C
MSEIWFGAGFFLFVMAAVVAVGYLFMRRSQRVEQIPAGLSTEPATHTVFVGLFRSIGEAFPATKNENNPYRVKLAAAGYRWPSALAIFYGIKFTSALFCAGLFATITLFSRGEADAALLPILCGGALGFMAPDRILASRVAARARRLRSAIPPALDLVVLGLEAGQSLDQSIADSSRSLKRTHPDFSAELAQLYLELKTGTTRALAFRNLATRSKDPEIRKLVNLMIDSDRFGASLAPALRTHSHYLRTRFRQQAQEAARKVGVKLIFPVFFLIFPSVLLVTLGPACIMMFQQMKALMQ